MAPRSLAWLMIGIAWRPHLSATPCVEASGCGHLPSAQANASAEGASTPPLPELLYFVLLAVGGVGAGLVLVQFGMNKARIIDDALQEGDVV